MIVQNFHDCYRLGARYVEACKDSFDASGQGFFNTELYDQMLVWRFTSWAFVIVCVVMAITVIIAAAANDNLQTRQKWGWAVGAVFVPPVFFALYFIFAPLPPAIEFPQQQTDAEPSEQGKA